MQAGGLTKAAETPEFGLWYWVSQTRDKALLPCLLTDPVLFWSVQGVTVPIPGVLAQVLGLRHLRYEAKTKSKETFTHVLGFSAENPFSVPCLARQGIG